MPRIDAIDPLLQAMPLWALGLILIVAGMLAVEAGALWSRLRLTKGRTREDTLRSETQGFIIGSVFGLLALLIGLTFSMALDRYDERRNWITTEANAISTAYLRADLFDEPVRGELRSALRQYTHSRIIPDNFDANEGKRRKAASEDIRDRLWSVTHDAVYPVRETELASYFVEAMNNMFDIGTTRVLAGRAHIPGAILDALFFYLLVSAGMLGALLAKDGTKQRISSTLLIGLFVLGIVMIVDIDRPRAGSIVVSQQGLMELAAAMDREARAKPPATSADQ